MEETCIIPYSSILLYHKPGAFNARTADIDYLGSWVGVHLQFTKYMSVIGRASVRPRCLTFLLPPVNVTFTKRRVYLNSSQNLISSPMPDKATHTESSSWPFPLAAWASPGAQPIHANHILTPEPSFHLFRLPSRNIIGILLYFAESYLWGLRLDFSGTSQRSMDFSHDCC